MRLLALVRYSLAVLAEVPVLDEGTRWIDLINDRVSVPIEASREDGDLVVSVGCAEAFEQIRADENTLGELAVRALGRLHFDD